MGSVQVGVYVKIAENAKNYNSGLIPSYAYRLTWLVIRMAGERCFLGSSKENPSIHLNIPINVKDLQVAE